jgi:hypothetical protein
MSRSISSLDDLRRQEPDVGAALYAFEPGGPVTLEVHMPDGQMFTWSAATEAEVLSQAFPQADDEAELPAPSVEIDIFG